MFTFFEGQWFRFLRFLAVFDGDWPDQQRSQAVDKQCNSPQGAIPVKNPQQTWKL
tara:strand:- start:297 stop:461 length:165 start_codon:yes stop_codon:yes gene_type:complete